MLGGIPHVWSIRADGDVRPYVGSGRTPYTTQSSRIIRSIESFFDTYSLRISARFIYGLLFLIAYFIALLTAPDLLRTT